MSSCSSSTDVESYRRRFNAVSARADARVSRVAMAIQRRRSQAGTNPGSSDTDAPEPSLRRFDRTPGERGVPQLELAELEPAGHVVGESRDERLEAHLPIVDATRRARLDQQAVGSRQLGEVIEVRGARRSRAVGRVEAASPVPTPERQPEGGVIADGASIRVGGGAHPVFAREPITLGVRPQRGERPRAHGTDAKRRARRGSARSGATPTTRSSR